MTQWLRKRTWHPLFPGLPTTAARLAAGRRYEALAGSIPELKAAAYRGARVARAVFVLASEGEWPLNERELDVLWHRFGVPVYTVELDRRGNVYAWECEAREGLHAVAGSSRIECECGRPGLVRRDGAMGLHPVSAPAA